MRFFGYNPSIRQRIYWSFALLVCLFLVNAIIINATFNTNKKSFTRITKVIDPSLQSLEDLKHLINESKMYTTNWVYVRFRNIEDKILYKKLYINDYVILKSRLKKYSAHWVNKSSVDTLNKIFTGFEQVLVIQKDIIKPLQTYKDYDHIAKSFRARYRLHNEIFPRTDVLLNSLHTLQSRGHAIRIERGRKLEHSYAQLEMFIILLTIITICAGIFLSIYLTKVIIAPLIRIREIVKNMGKGITHKLNHHTNKDEIGKMIRAVNNLSEKLNATAAFAKEVGNRNFNADFQPLSDEDTLGKALITMRDSLLVSERDLYQTTIDLMQRNRDLEQFTYIISHNVRSQIASILGLSDLYELEEDPKEKQKMLDGIFLSTKKLDEVIMDLNQILQVKQNLNDKVEKISFSELIKDIKLNLSDVIKKGNVNIKTDFTEISSILTIKSYLYSIFFNLISNSIKYRRQDVDPVIEIKSSRDKNKIQLSFTDNGKGIDLEKYGEKLFGLYNRFDLTVDGKGMGLFMTKAQIEALNGKITVQSHINKGTTFKLDLPDNSGNLN